MAVPAAAATGTDSAVELNNMKQALLIILMILAVLFLGALFGTTSLLGKKNSKIKASHWGLVVALYLVMIFVGCTFVFCLQQYRTAISDDYDIPDVVQTEPPLTTALPTTEPTDPTTETTVEPTTMPTEPAPTEDPPLSFEAVRT